MLPTWKKNIKKPEEMHKKKAPIVNKRFMKFMACLDVKKKEKEGFRGIWRGFNYL